MVLARALNQAWAISECRALYIYSHMPDTSHVPTLKHLGKQGTVGQSLAASTFPLAAFLPACTQLDGVEISKERGEGILKLIENTST